jgi:ATP-binding cassette subfamily F protein 2
MYISLGLIGENGSGKSNVLAAIAQRDVPLPDEIDVFHLHQEAEPTEQSAVEAVVGHVIAEAARIEALSLEILEASGPDDVRLAPLYERLDELDPTGAEPRARKILSGLGFDDALVPMDRKTKHMSGGWRMRVSLAQALFAQPSVCVCVCVCVQGVGLRLRAPNDLLHNGSSRSA